MESLRPAMHKIRLSATPRHASCAPPRPRYQCLHTCSPLSRAATATTTTSATPPTTPEPSEAMARVARKRRQADMMKQAREMRDVYAPSNKPKSTLAKRFWKDVHVREAEGGTGLQVFLDHRPVRLPDKQTLTLPPTKPLLATAIALEWDLLMSAQQALKTDYIPMTSLAARAVDIAAADAAARPRPRADILAYLLRVLSTDTLLCWAPENVLNETMQNGKTLRELQRDVATDMMAYLTTHVWPGVELLPTLDPASIIPVAQPRATQEAIRAWCAGLPAFELAGLERAVLASKSMLVGARLIFEWGEAFAQARPTVDGPRFGIQEAATASSLEVRWQTAQWGEVEDTHDVEREDLRRQLGSAVILVGGVSDTHST